MKPIHPLRVLLPMLAAIACLLSACAHTAPSVENAGVSFVVVRHAERSSDDPRDPNLSDAGRARAAALAASLAGAPVAAVYATAYRRTQQTAAPSASAHALTVTTYDAKQPAAEFAAQLKRTHPRGTVLVVGHSNTAPEIAAALCACTVEPMGDAEYDRRLRIDIGADGVAKLSVSRY
ncbi:histidine phosphatase family protein [Lysobacter koreensis]|uniref:Histidine phosphatase family protein n=1 Tax=Lysobacter koreensis TaxID=266122 RepID=A0ABW2YJY2_9GAMM